MDSDWKLWRYDYICIEKVLQQLGEYMQVMNLLINEYLEPNISSLIRENIMAQYSSSKILEWFS